MTTLHAVPSARTRHLFLDDPRDLSSVELEPGSHLHIRFVRRPGYGRWRVAEVPSYLVPLRSSTHEFYFLTFAPGPDGTDQSLRFERAGSMLGVARESRTLSAVPVRAAVRAAARAAVSAAAARTPRGASRRSA